MNLLEMFCSELNIMNIPEHIEDIDYILDNSNFNIVDGEEGDYGIKRYLSNDNQLLAVRHIFGGDYEEIEFTELSKKILGDKVLEIIKYQIEKL